MSESNVSAEVKPIEYGHAGVTPYRPFYSHSGKVTLRGTALSVVVGLLVAVLTGFIYAYADLYIPIVYLNVMLCLGFGAVIGAAAAAVLRWGKVRNVPVALAIVAVLTLVAYYVCWDVWAIAVFDRFKVPRPIGFVGLLVRPDLIYRMAYVINDAGTWSMGSSSSPGNENVSGIALLAVWVGEALCIFGTSLAVAKSMASDRPFCEKCDAWCAPDRLVATLKPIDKRELKEAFVGRNWPLIAQSIDNVGGGGVRHWIALQHHACSSCNQLNTLTAVETKVTVDKKGKSKVNKKVVMNKLIVTAEEVAYLKALPPVSQA